MRPELPPRETSPAETSPGNHSAIHIEFLDKHTIALQNAVESSPKETFTSRFTRCFSAHSSQQEVYEEVVAPVVSSVLDGYNGTIFAYGHTGTGKTYTMMGPVGTDTTGVSAGNNSVQDGIVPRALGQLFEQVAHAESGVEFQVWVSYVQLYCEVIYDLLEPRNHSLLLRESKEKGVYVDNATRLRITDLAQAMQVIHNASQNRALAQTNLNDTSSRSHTCLIIDVIRRRPADSRERAGSGAALPGRPKVTVGKLVLVDLAGSERVKQAHGNGQHHMGIRFMESRAINLSLSALGNCINALANGRKHVPYRDAKLTHLLRDALGGNCKTSLIINASSRLTLVEARSSLQFGERALNVQSSPVVNQQLDFEALYVDLQEKHAKKDLAIQSLQLQLENTCKKLATAHRQLQEGHDEMDKQTTSHDQPLGDGGQHPAKPIPESVATQTTQDRAISSTPLKAQATATHTAHSVNELSHKGATPVTVSEDQHADALQALKLQLTKAFVAERETLESELKSLDDALQAEKREHLSTCRQLSTKQSMLSSAEALHSQHESELRERIAELQHSVGSLSAQAEKANKEAERWKAKAESLRQHLSKEPPQPSSEPYEQRIAQLARRVAALEREKRHQPRCSSREEGVNPLPRSKSTSKLHFAGAHPATQKQKVRQSNNSYAGRSKALATVAADILRHN